MDAVSEAAASPVAKNPAGSQRAAVQAAELFSGSRTPFAGAGIPRTGGRTTAVRPGVRPPGAARIVRGQRLPGRCTRKTQTFRTCQTRCRPDARQAAPLRDPDVDSSHPVRTLCRCRGRPVGSVHRFSNPVDLRSNQNASRYGVAHRSGPFRGSHSGRPEKAPASRRTLWPWSKPGAWFCRSALPGARKGKPHRSPCARREWSNTHCCLRERRSPTTIWWRACRETSPSATREKVEKLLTDLWEQTFLLTDLRPPLTTDDPARYVAARLAGIPEAEDLLKRLDELLTASAAWDRLDDAEDLELFETQLTQAGIISDRSQQPPVQVDMAMSVDGRVNHAGCGRSGASSRTPAAAFSLPAWVLRTGRVSSGLTSAATDEREVALLELLDPNRGLGAMSPHAHAPVGPDPAKAAQRARTLLQLACTALRDHKRTVMLDDETISRLETWQPVRSDRAPVSLDINFLLGARSAAAIDEKDFTIVVGPNLGALAAGRNLARFSHLLAPDGPALPAGCRRGRRSSCAGPLMG